MGRYSSNGIGLFPTEGMIAELQRLLNSTVDTSTVIAIKHIKLQEGEKRLAAGVLTLAIKDWVEHIDGSPRHYKNRTALENWFLSADIYPFSFLDICDTLNLPALEIRRQLFAANSSVRVPRKSPVVGDRCRVMVA